jgi:hypothetical protein
MKIIAVIMLAALFFACDTNGQPPIDGGNITTMPTHNLGTFMTEIQAARAAWEALHIDSYRFTARIDMPGRSFPPMTVTVFPDREPEWMPADPVATAQYDSGWQLRGTAFYAYMPGTIVSIEGTTICGLYASFEEMVDSMQKWFNDTFTYSATYDGTYFYPLLLNVDRSLPPDDSPPPWGSGPPPVPTTPGMPPPSRSVHPNTAVVDGNFTIRLTILSFEDLRGR